jgi:uncharacterized membrane protein
MADDGPAPETRGDDTGALEADPPTATIEDLLFDLIELETETPGPETGETILAIKQLLAEAHDRGLIESDVRTLDARDVAEAFVGSVVFAAPLLVEDGVFDIAEHLLGTTRGVPVFLIANALFVVLVTHALIEWTGRDRRERRTFLGGIPARLLVTLAVSFAVAALLMTIWGRVGGWQSPTETLARVSVLWTVGSLGAALGDILATDADPEGTMRRHAARVAGHDAIESAPSIDRPNSVQQLADGALLEAIGEHFDELESVVDDATDRGAVTRIRARAIEATLEDAFGDRIEKYTSRDVAEAFVGSIVFAIPFLVEDGVFDVAAYFLSFRVGPVPVFFLANTAFVLVVISGLVYWAGPQDVPVTRPLLGFIPRRLLGTAVVAFLTAGALMTLWGRVDHWQDPVVAVARISVVWTVAAFGAALGDILPGESSGADINDELAALGERTGTREDSADARDR